jgi:hypothetical protein
MTELEKYDLINTCETGEELQEAIDIIWEGKNGAGRRGNMRPSVMREAVPQVCNGQALPNVLTRQYGLRQQAIYIAYYKQLEEMFREKSNTNEQ